ncbi:MAG: FUSC family protein [Chelatococcus sp.]|uniref:FUSC family protein n=1 Tax=Chelatococcus sp. TaxID=1953771 RepID=UPI0025C4D647|nr:FUSC family protein [Chelatococcus sp.]MBX3540182.1 FUSC family protein [Chelatococcus sp.]
MDAISRQSLVTAAACLIATLVAIAAGLEQPFWATITAFIVSNVDTSALVTKAVLRLVGTAIGCVVGYFAAVAMEGLPFAQAAALFLASAIGTYGRFRSRFGYAWILGAASVMLLVTSSMSDPTDLYIFAWTRFYEISIGVLVATVLAWGFSASGPISLQPAPVAVAREAAMEQAVSAGIAAVVIALLWNWFDLPSLPQVIVTSLVVVSQDLGASRLRGAQRMMGCILGGCLGLIVILIDAADFLWWAVALVSGIFLASRLHLSPHKHAYVGTQIGIAFMITLVTGGGPPDSILAPVNRLSGMVAGVAVMLTVMWMMSGKLHRAVSA